MEELSSLITVEKSTRTASAVEAIAVDTILVAAKSLLCFLILVFLSNPLLLILSLIMPNPCCLNPIHNCCSLMQLDCWLCLVTAVVQFICVQKPKKISQVRKNDSLFVVSLGNCDIRSSVCIMTACLGSY
ncbi:hypothetical protein ACSQ67_006800 [Phaseolus vulgaris]